MEKQHWQPEESSIGRGFATKTGPLVVGSELIGLLTSLFKKKGKDTLPGRARKAIEQLGRAFAFYIGIHGLTVKDRSPSWVFGSAALLNLMVRPFSWNMSLFICVRAVVDAMRRHKMEYHMHPVAIFLSHCVHNHLLVNKADWVVPAYLKLWLTTLHRYPKLENWLEEFSSVNTCEDRYAAEQCSEKRLKELPKSLLYSFKKQLPFVGMVYLLPTVMFYQKSLKKAGGSIKNIALEVVSRTLRTSVVLALLPHCLTEFPCVYDKLGRMVTGNKDPTPPERAPLLHVAVASLASTLVFLAEPKERLNVILVYTYWRIAEAFITKVSNEDAESLKKQSLRQPNTFKPLLSSLSIGLAASAMTL